MGVNPLGSILARVGTGIGEVVATVDPAAQEVAQAGEQGASQAPEYVADAYTKTKPGPAGAYYCKLSTGASQDNVGISASATLPTPSLDSGRWQYPPVSTDAPPPPSLPNQRGCDRLDDRPSMYLGGGVNGREVDAGLTWDRVYDDKGNQTFTSDPSGSVNPEAHPDQVFHYEKGKWMDAQEHPAPSGIKLTPNYAFRPYCRTTNPGQTQWNTPNPVLDSSNKDRPKNAYFYPGEHVNMEFKTIDPAVAANDLVVKQVDGNDETLKQDCNIRLSISSGDRPNATYDAEFHQQGWPGDTVTPSQVPAHPALEFKRVMSIDQNGAEPKPGHPGGVSKTDTSLTGGGWDNTNIELKNGKTEALNSKNGTRVHPQDKMIQNYGDVFHFRKGSFDGGGKEYVDITPPKRT
jgi:hypothetical protein